MSRKRALKKQQKRQESVLAQLEELYLRGADDEFLALAAEQLKDPAASPLAAEWAEAADRALRQSLARADLGRLERLLSVLRRGGSLCPGIGLAEAVLDLAAGRLEAARSRLAALAAAAEEAASNPPGLIAALQSLSEDQPDSRWPLDDPCLQAAGQLFRALQALEARAFAPTGADRQALARSLEAVRAAAPTENGDLGRLLDSAGRSLSLLADLEVLEDKLSRLPKSTLSSASQLVAAWLRGPGPLLAATLTATGPPLLAPLQHTVHLRWRAVLEQVAAREGSPGLAALCAADPKLFARDVSLPGGIQAGLASLRQGAQTRQLLAGGQYRGLAGLLRSCSQTESDSGALAALWSLELWATNHRSKNDECEDSWFLDLDLSEPPPHRTLVRLQEMAGETGRRFPVERQAEVARALREKLFDLCEQIPLCEHVARAALLLLEHLPGDLGLCIAGIAGAIAGDDSRALRAVEAGLTRGIKPQADDAAIARRLMIQVGREAPETIARALERLKPLFSDESWPVIAALVAWEMGAPFADALNEASFAALENRRWGDQALAEVRRHLDRLRPALAGAPGFAAMELAVDCWQPDRSQVEKGVKAFLRTGPGLEVVLAAFLVLDRAAETGSLAPRGVATAVHALAHALIDLLDERWRIWESAVRALALAIRGRHLKRLEEKIRQLLASPQLEAGREALEQALRTVETIRNARAGRAPRPDPPQAEPKPKPKPKPKKPRRQRTGTPQLRLEI